MNPDFVDFLTALLSVEARFLVVGAHALAVHGVPRATGDIDIWIDRSPSNVALVWRAMAAFGDRLRRWACGKPTSKRQTRSSRSGYRRAESTSSPTSLR